jgi:hypothetical protein
MTREEMSVIMSDKQTELARKLRSEMTAFKCFMYEGVYFKGDATQAALDFAFNNPTGGDFYVWLQDNYQMITIQ